jgi:ketosteroid isomerase-like protein
MRREWDTYSTFLADDYTRITDTGEVQSREEVLRGFKGGTGGGGKMEPSDLNVKVYGDTAILTGLLKVTRPGTPEPRVSRFRKVFIRRDGRWYLVSLQGVRYAP